MRSWNGGSDRHGLSLNVESGTCTRRRPPRPDLSCSAAARRQRRPVPPHSAGPMPARGAVQPDCSSVRQLPPVDLLANRLRLDMTYEVRRHRHRRRPQRPGQRRLPGARRARRCWCSSAATCSAAPPSPRRSSPASSSRVCSYVVSLLRPEIIRDLDLPRHGLEILPLDGTFTPMPNGDYLWRVNDHAQDPPRDRAPLAASTPRPTTNTARRWSRWAASSSPSSA